MYQEFEDDDIAKVIPYQGSKAVTITSNNLKLIWITRLVHEKGDKVKDLELY